MLNEQTIVKWDKNAETDLHSGLTEAQVKERQTIYGPNRLKEGKKKSVLKLFWEQLNDPLIYILMAAIAISLFLGEAGESMIIAAVIILNAVVGVIQEGKAIKAIEALQQLSSPKALVKRDGRTRGSDCNGNRNADTDRKDCRNDFGEPGRADTTPEASGRSGQNLKPCGSRHLCIPVRGSRIAETGYRRNAAYRNFTGCCGGSGRTCCNCDGGACLKRFKNGACRNDRAQTPIGRNLRSGGCGLLGQDRDADM